MIESSHKDFLSRRDFLAGIASAGAGAMIAGIVGAGYCHESANH